ncbi:MAG: hypothetical protein JWO12_2382 [Frankiales bacterium]|nr:hypothetical protein [Frankiales bacterium]
MRSFRRVVETDATVEEVFGVLSGAEWAAQRAEHLGDDSKLVSREVGDDGSVELVISRALPAGVPGFLQRFLPSEPRALTKDFWGPLVDGVRRATWSADIAGAPASLTGTMTIEPLPTGGNRHTIEGACRVNVPLIGGKAESFIAEQCGRLADAEAEVVRTVLAG